MAAFKIKNENGEIIEVPALMGLSAYQIALENGFEGTEQEWLESLKGETGKDGGIDINTAAIGQTIKVSAVDKNGKPTAWEATDFPEGGSGGEWELITEATTTEVVKTLSFDNLNREEVFFYLDTQLCTDTGEALSGGTDALLLTVNGKQINYTSNTLLQRAKRSYIRGSLHLNGDRSIDANELSLFTVSTAPVFAKNATWAHATENGIESISFGIQKADSYFAVGTICRIYGKK